MGADVTALVFLTATIGAGVVELVPGMLATAGIEVTAVVVLVVPFTAVGAMVMFGLPEKDQPLNQVAGFHQAAKATEGTRSTVRAKVGKYFFIKFFMLIRRKPTT